MAAILPEDIDWKPFPAFPPSVRLAVIVGERSPTGPHVIKAQIEAAASMGRAAL